MSGGPAFYPSKPERVMGVALGSLESEVVIHTVGEYESEGVTERERISRIVEYGVALRLQPLRDWLSEVLRS
jgi:hypothetical protein